MADTKISALTAKTIPVAADTTVIVDSVGGANKKITLGKVPLLGNAELIALATGLLKNTTGTGTLSIAAAGTDYLVGKGVTSSGAGPVAVTAANNRMTYVATAAVEYDLPTGDLSAYISTSVDPLQYTFVKKAAGTLTIDPGANNFIADGAASATLSDSVAAETYATCTVRLISSAASVNTWVIIGAHGSWIKSA